MKTLNEYMAMSYRMEIVEDKEEGGFVASYPDLPGCITCGETVASTIENALDAKRAGLKRRWKKVLRFTNPTAWRTIRDSSN